MKLYKYTLLKQDGTTQDLGVSKEKDFSELYKILNCTTIEHIPQQYYAKRGYGRCQMWGDEEGRFFEKNHTNPHFDVLAPGYDVVGDIVKQEVYHDK